MFRKLLENTTFILITNKSLLLYFTVFFISLEHFLRAFSHKYNVQFKYFYVNLTDCYKFHYIKNFHTTVLKNVTSFYNFFLISFSIYSPKEKASWTFLPFRFKWSFPWIKYNKYSAFVWGVVIVKPALLVCNLKFNMQHKLKFSRSWNYNY